MIRSIICGLCLTAAIWPAPGHSQPYSDSMADCTGLALAAAHHLQTPDRKAFAEQTAAMWIDAAIAQAKSEGRTTAEAQMAARADATRAAWLEDGVMMPFSENFRDWTSYCRKFGRAQGVF